MPATLEPPTRSVDDSLDALVHRAEENIVHCMHDMEDFVRKSPTKAVLGAAAAGYLLRHLPLRSLIVANVRLITALAPPALVLYGAAKVYEFVQEQASSSGSGQGGGAGGGEPRPL